MDSRARGRAIFGGLALAALAHKVTTSGCNPSNGDMNPFSGVDLLAAATSTKWSLPVRLPVVTQQAVSPSFVAQLGCKEDEGNPSVALLKLEKRGWPRRNVRQGANMLLMLASPLFPRPLP